MTQTKKMGRPAAPTAENFISLYTEGVEVPNEEVAQTNTLKAGVTVLTVRDIVARCKYGKIRGYKYNRGHGKVIPSTINNIAENFIPHVVGMLTLAEDGTVVDSHNRIGGMCLRAKKGLMTASDWDANIPVRVVSAQQFIETYKYLGDGKPHVIGDHLSNPDLLLGSCIVGDNGLYSYLEQIGCTPEEMQILKSSSMLTIVGNILTAMHLTNAGQVSESIGKIKSYIDAYKVRSTMREMARSLKGAECKVVHPKDYLRLANGCRYYAQFVLALRHAKVVDDALPSIASLASNSGLRGLIISDIVFSEDHRTLTSVAPEVLAARLLHRAAKVESMLANILGSDNKNGAKAARIICKIAQRPIKGEVK